MGFGAQVEECFCCRWHLLEEVPSKHRSFTQAGREEQRCSAEEEVVREGPREGRWSGGSEQPHLAGSQGASVETAVPGTLRTPSFSCPKIMKTVPWVSPEWPKLPRAEAKGHGAIEWIGDRSAAQAERSEEESQEAPL